MVIPRAPGCLRRCLTVACCAGLLALGPPIAAGAAVRHQGPGHSANIEERDFHITAPTRLSASTDRLFIQGIEHDPKDVAIAANLVSLAHALGLDVVAEGIETEGQLAQLVELGCDLGQGYLLGRPAPASAVSALLAAQRTPASTTA